MRAWGQVGSVLGRFLHDGRRQPSPYPSEPYLTGVQKAMLDLLRRDCTGLLTTWDEAFLIHLHIGRNRKITVPDLQKLLQLYACVPHD